MSKLIFSFVVSIVLTGCFNSSVEAELIKERDINSSNRSNRNENNKEPHQLKSSKNVVDEVGKSAKFKPSKELEKVKNYQELLVKFYQIFRDSAKISPEGKEMMIIFGQPNDPYTKKLQKDVVEDSNLSKTILENLTPYYIDATKVKMHKFMHNGELIDVDTKTLTSIYSINSTPTIIFLDKNAKSIFIVPGYMPPKQFIVTVNFIKDKKYKGKNRKNGEVYEELKKYYISNGIAVKAKK